MLAKATNFSFVLYGTRGLAEISKPNLQTFRFVPGSTEAPSGPVAPPPSFVPAVRESAPARIARDVSMTDLESARAAVADLAAASAVVYPGLQWAVVVARGASGIPEMWMTSNEAA